MSPLLSSVAAVSLLAHCVLGCCWHHVHACEDRGTQEASDSGPCHAGGLGAGCPGGQDLCRTIPPAHDDCPSGRCVFVGAQRIVLASPPSQACWPAATPASRPVDSVASAPAGGWPSLDRAAGVPPLRIHLLYQTLLI